MAGDGNETDFQIMTPEMREWLARRLYVHFQESVEHDGIHFASSLGTFEDANNYTQRIFREGVAIVAEEVVRALRRQASLQVPREGEESWKP